MSRRKGFTTVELVVGVLILGVGILPVMTSMVSTTRATGFTGAHALAQMRAQSILDLLSSIGLEELARSVADDGSLEWADADRELLPAAAGIEVVEERMQLEKLSPVLGALSVVVVWRQPGKPETHRTRCFRLITRPDHSWVKSIPLT